MKTPFLTRITPKTAPENLSSDKAHGEILNGETADNASQFGPLAPHYDELMEIVPYDSWVDYVETLFLLAEHEPNRVLDCACGTGNVSFEMARRGWEVTGVDLSAPMIEVAQQKSRDLVADGDAARFVSGDFSPAPRFFCDDLTTFDLGETFDGATCLYDSLNYILEPEKLKLAFARIAAHVEKGGVFVFDMNSDWAFKADLFTQRNLDSRKKLNYDWHAHFDPQTRICAVQMEFQRTQNGKTETFYETHRERAYERAEVETMLEETGWELLRAFDAYTLNAPHARSERWYFLAQRR